MLRWMAKTCDPPPLLTPMWFWCKLTTFVTYEGGGNKKTEKTNRKNIHWF